MRSGVGADQPVSAAIAARRSVRKFASMPVDGATVEDLVALACAAPAPHHSRPWRFVHVGSPAVRDRLADAMADAWRADLEREGKPVLEVAGLLQKSQTQLADAPVLLLACLSRRRPEEVAGRRHAVGPNATCSCRASARRFRICCSQQAKRGLAGYLKGAPLFCADAVREALELPARMGADVPGAAGLPGRRLDPAPRDPVDVDEFMIER